MRGGAIPSAIHVRTTFVILCNASMKRNGQPATTDSLPYTYTYILGRKAKIDLHMTPKLTVVMPISCLLRSIQFPNPQNDAITPERSPLAPVLVLYVFSQAPQ